MTSSWCICRKCKEQANRAMMELARQDLEIKLTWRRIQDADDKLEVLQEQRQ